MVRSLLLALTLCVLVTAPLHAQALYISVYADIGGYSRFTADAEGIMNAYVIGEFVTDVRKVRYRINTCLTSWAWSHELNYWPATTGQSHSGVTIDFDRCRSDDSVLLQHIVYISDGTTPLNSSIWVQAHPEATIGHPEALSFCSGPSPSWWYAQGTALCVNCEEGRACGISSEGIFYCQRCDGLPLPVEARTWGSVKALYR